MQISQTWFPGTHCTYLKKLTQFVKVLCKSVENSLRYWPNCAVLVKKWGHYPSFWLSQKIKPIPEGFIQNLEKFIEI